MAEVFKPTLTGDQPADLRLTWRTDTRARARLEQRIFGKRILFTNREYWTTAQVVAAYRSQNDVESGFRQSSIACTVGGASGCIERLAPLRTMRSTR